VNDKTLPLIARSNLSRSSLENRVAVITGGGSGVGREAARALAWLGARTVIAEIDPLSGHETAAQVNREIHPKSSVFISTNVGDEESVNHMARQVIRLFGQVDIILNNAAVMPIGALRDQSIREWDASYRVNLRGPILLLRVFLPAMLQQGSGIIAFIAPEKGRYLSAYESLKMAQSELPNLVNAELEKDGVIGLLIQPGNVDTPEKISSRQRRLAMLEKQDLSNNFPASQSTSTPEMTGAAIAGAITLAQRYHGSEIHTAAILREIGLA